MGELWDRAVSEFARLPDDQRWLIGISAVVFALIFLVVVWAKSRARRHARLNPPPVWKPPPARVEIARIIEKVEVTGGGGVGIAMLLLHQFGIFVLLSSSSTAFHEIFYAVIWAGGNVLWGLVIVLGRQRTYVVTREGPKES